MSVFINELTHWRRHGRSARVPGRDAQPHPRAPRAKHARQAGADLRGCGRSVHRAWLRRGGDAGDRRTRRRGCRHGVPVCLVQGRAAAHGLQPRAARRDRRRRAGRRRARRPGRLGRRARPSRPGELGAQPGQRRRLPARAAVRFGHRRAPDRGPRARRRARGRDRVPPRHGGPVSRGRWTRGTAGRAHRLRGAVARACRAVHGRASRCRPRRRAARAGRADRARLPRHVAIHHRNTLRSLTMYYSSGTMEAFARPRKPEGVENKTAWFVGAGLASMASAAFMIRDGQMDGSKITILERLKLPGGALDGIEEPKKGFVVRGGREVDDHYECLWDLYRSIPSIEVDGASVLDEFYWLNKDDPNSSLQRATVEQGKDAGTGTLFTLSEQAQKELTELFLATRGSMEGKRINEVFGKEFFASNFWMYWRTMFAFEEWHSALEMKLYVHRFVHHIGGMPDFAGVRFFKYNQYESMVLPLYRWLLDQGVTFRFDTEVTDIDFAITADRKQATAIHWISEGVVGGLSLIHISEPTRRTPIS